MGDTSVSALVNNILERLTSAAIQESMFGQLWGFKNNISTLKDNFNQIKPLLQDAEEKHIKEKPVELWVKSLKSVSMEVENVLDEISTEAMLQSVQKERGIVHMVRPFFSLDYNRIMLAVRIGQKVKEVSRQLDGIKAKGFELELTPSSGNVSHVDVGVEGVMPDRESSVNIHSSLLVGRDEEMEMITRKICNNDVGKRDDDKIRVYGIWGMEGVGKTTLARLVYSHQRVVRYFDLKFWIYTTRKFQVEEIIKEIIECVDRRECGLTQLDMLQESLRHKLRGKTFLIVLDDVWFEDGERNKWDELSETLSCGAEKSIVLITTRSQTTSRVMAEVPELQHKLGCLSEEDSWLLFKKLAFAKGREGGDISELEPIGKEIVEKCKGLPLVLKTLGSLMWSKGSIGDWRNVRDNHIWELKENILPALKLSYDNLLPHIKRCFAYCCMFPKGYDIEKDVVIPLWVSNGFIPPHGDTDLYVLGEEVFDCLVWRSFFQVDKKGRYKLHDLMHDMAQYMMRNECLIIESGDQFKFQDEEALHLSTSCSNLPFSPHDLEKLASLRSIFMYGRINEESISQIFYHMYLRVLYLPGIRLRTLPDAICKLKLLKYMNLSHSSIQVLPESIVYLQNLQVLLLYSCKNLHELPESISKLKRLKFLNLSHSGIDFLPESIIHLQDLQVLLLGSCYLHKLPEGLRHMKNLQRLDISSCYSLLQLPLGIKELTSIRTLPLFRVHKESGVKIGELGDLNLLEGELEIMPLENVKGFSEAKSANLKSKRNLQALMLRWSGVRMPESAEGKMRVANDEKVLEGLEPNPSLKELKIFYYMGKLISPSWMVNLTNLVEISFYGCKNSEHIPTLGRLPNLKVIKLADMDSLKCFDNEDNNMSGDTDTFLCLQNLDIYKCPNLVSLPNNLPKLEALRLVECNGLVSLPDGIQSFNYLNTLVIIRCEHLSERCEREVGVDWHKVSHITNIKIDSPR